MTLLLLVTGLVRDMLTVPDQNWSGLRELLVQLELNHGRGDGIRLVDLVVSGAFGQFAPH